MIPASTGRWRDQAACAGVPEPLWDASVAGETPQVQESRHHRAKTVCRTCPVTQECLAEALISHVEGVWGGRLLISLATRSDSRNPDIRHGSSGGSKAHYRRGEKPCAACVSAESRARQTRRRKGME